MTNLALLTGLVAGQVAGNFHARAMQRQLAVDNDDSLNAAEKMEARVKIASDTIHATVDYAGQLAMAICQATDLDPGQAPTILMGVEDEGIVRLS